MIKKELIHRPEFHLINEADICKATTKLVETLNMAAGSTDGFDIYKVIESYFTNLNKRHQINELLDIPQDSEYFADKFD